MKPALDDLVEGYSGDAFRRSTECPICAAGSRFVHIAINSHPQKPFRFEYRICKRCDHGWIHPMPTQGLLNYLYSSGSLSVIGEGWEDTKPCGLTIPEQRVAWDELGDSTPVGRYFELGVGKGTLYNAFQAAGWQCCGVEPGRWGRAYAGVISSMDSVPNSYRADVIVANDVLEHIADPIATIRRLHELSAEGARFYCSVPNRQSLRAYVGRKNWRMLKPLGHVHYWSKKSVTHALEASRFSIEKLIRTDLYEPSPVRTLRQATKAGIERFGLGDQWIVIAKSHR